MGCPNPDNCPPPESLVQHQPDPTDDENRPEQDRAVSTAWRPFEEQSCERVAHEHCQDQCPGGDETNTDSGAQPPVDEVNDKNRRGDRRERRIRRKQRLHRNVENQPIVTYAAAAPQMTLEGLSWHVDDVVIRELQGEVKPPAPKAEAKEQKEETKEPPPAEKKEVGVKSEGGEEEEKDPKAEKEKEKKQ